MSVYLTAILRLQFLRKSTSKTHHNNGFFSLFALQLLESLVTGHALALRLLARAVKIQYQNLAKNKCPEKCGYMLFPLLINLHLPYISCDLER